MGGKPSGRHLLSSETVSPDDAKNAIILNQKFESKIRSPKHDICYNAFLRGVAQPGSVHAWGACGRRFKSSHPDHEHSSLVGLLSFLLSLLFSTFLAYVTQCKGAGPIRTLALCP